MNKFKKMLKHIKDLHKDIKEWYFSFNLFERILMPILLILLLPAIILTCICSILGIKMTNDQD